MTKLNYEQEKVVTTSKKKVLVASCAGSGKTRCLTERLKYLLDNGYKEEDIVAITYTNAAAAEISERLNSSSNLFIGTIHSLANKFLLSGGIQTYEYLSQEQFDKLFSLVKQNPSCIKKVKYLLLDEAQDSTPEQFEFIFDMINPEEWMLFADWRQSIFRWNGAYPDYILNLINHPGVTCYNLSINYRCKSEILDFAKSIIRLEGGQYLDFSVPGSEGGKVINVEYSSDAIARTIATRKDYGDWFILTRKNDQIDEISKALSKYKIPYDTFKKTQLNSKELNQKMKENTVKVLTIHTSKGLENKNVVVIGARTNDTEETCISYVAATRAKELLVWTMMPNKRRKMQKSIKNWER